jgi:hypothetical protein
MDEQTLSVEELDMRDMRGWLDDCAYDEGEIERLSDLCDSAIMRIVDRSYEGGLSQFFKDSPWGCE